MSQDNIIAFEAGYFYHVYNRAVGNERLFYQERNYVFFLDRYTYLLREFAETYAYALLPNHFHLMIRIPERIEKPEKCISEQFRRFGISYASAINKQENRKGSLLMRPFKRKKIQSDAQFFALVFYIHCNAVHHGLVNNFYDYPWLSYHSLISEKKTFLAREKLLEFYGGMENFIKSHKIHLEYYKEFLGLDLER